ncbi:MAG: ABC transporter ATP-binding protein [Bdellovibrionaceae bacterium]|nr:ABC transporter ATP-binding protein [Pseudobdellovibrionaceae bacterium]
MSSVELKNVSKSFGETEVLKNISLKVESGEFLVLVGPSGCGKSTLLRLIAGLETATSGEIWIDGKNVSQLDPRDRNLAMVFQSYALYPHLSVRENLAFGLALQGVSKEEQNRRVQEVADTLQIGPLLDRRPRALSGGQRQRVALGRALVRRTKLILFDEPLSNLDAALRAQMRFEIKKLHQLTGATMVYVTHDQVEATTLGDRIAVLNKGVVAQIGSAHSIYEKPESRFVASFIGTPEMNFLPGELVGQNGKVVGVRPEDFVVNGRESSGTPEFDATFELEEYLGSQSLVHTKVGDMGVRFLTPESLGKKPGASIKLGTKPGRLHVFDPKSEARINS